MSVPDRLVDTGAHSTTLTGEGAVAVRELEAAIKKCAKALEDSKGSYEQLLVEHTALKKTHEATGSNVRVSTGQGGIDTYVVVLIDAHSHKFLSNLACGNTNGGSLAAKLLKAAITRYLGKIDSEEISFRTVLRVYANLKSLSTEVLKDNGAPPLALAAFAAGFSREEVSFDFVDVGDEKIVQAKILDLFKHHVKDPQCKHIIFGACCGAKYMMALQAHSLYHDKITLLQGTAIDPGMLQLGLQRVAFTQVFRSTTTNIAELPAKIPAELLLSGICWDYQREGCFRNNCKFKHIGFGTSKKKTTPLSFKSSASPKSTSSIPSKLPTQSISGLIPINTSGQRLDTYMRPPTSTQWSKFETRCKLKKLCKNFFLLQSCTANPCSFDHSLLDCDEYYCLRYVRRGYPCFDKGKCRRLNCCNGHACQMEACVNGRVKTCRLMAEMHGMDYELADWVKPDAAREGAHELDDSSQGSIERLRVPEVDLILL